MKENQNCRDSRERSFQEIVDLMKSGNDVRKNFPCQFASCVHELLECPSSKDSNETFIRLHDNRGGVYGKQ